MEKDTSTPMEQQIKNYSYLKTKKQNCIAFLKALT